MITIEMEEILPELIVNWDQMGRKIVPSNIWTMEEQGLKRADVASANNKRQITALFCGSLLGDFLSVQVIYQGKTPHYHPSYQFLHDWDITYSPKHWSNKETVIQYMEG